MSVDNIFAVPLKKSEAEIQEHQNSHPDLPQKLDVDHGSKAISKQISKSKNQMRYQHSEECCILPCACCRKQSYADSAHHHKHCVCMRNPRLVFPSRLRLWRRRAWLRGYAGISHDRLPYRKQHLSSSAPCNDGAGGSMRECLRLQLFD